MIATTNFFLLDAADGTCHVCKNGTTFAACVGTAGSETSNELPGDCMDGACITLQIRKLSVPFASIYEKESFDSRYINIEIGSAIRG